MSLVWSGLIPFNLITIPPSLWPGAAKIAPEYRVICSAALSALSDQIDEANATPISILILKSTIIYFRINILIGSIAPPLLSKAFPVESSIELFDFVSSLFLFLLVSSSMFFQNNFLLQK